MNNEKNKGATPTPEQVRQADRLGLLTGAAINHALARRPLSDPDIKITFKTLAVFIGVSVGDAEREGKGSTTASGLLSLHKQFVESGGFDRILERPN